MAPQVMRKIIFLIHASIYAAHRGEPEFIARNAEYIEYERSVEERWLKAMDKMSANEALVACSPATEDMVDAITSRLKSRGLIIRESIIDQPGLWDILLEVPARIGLGHDLMAMYWRHGYNWDSRSLVQPIIARGWAERIKAAFIERGIRFDPAKVETEGWGESFEGCVANYTRYLGTYLGLKRSIDPRFEMTVPDARFLLGACFIEKIALTREVRLYLWRAGEETMIGWFHRAFASIGDPTIFSLIPADSMRLEVRGKRELYWPVRDSEVQWIDGCLKIPVEGDHFILAQAVQMKEFRETLMGAELVGEDGKC